MHRYNKCNEILNKINLDDSNDLIYIFVWLRYSNIRQLDWQRKYNTRPSELSHSMNRFSSEITNKIAYIIRSKKFENIM